VFSFCVSFQNLCSLTYLSFSLQIYPLRSCIVRDILFVIFLDHQVVLVIFVITKL